jgi:tyrosyl-tRNA synthetase
VRLDGEKITDVDAEFQTEEELTGKTLQVGKKKFIRLVSDQKSAVDGQE